MVEYETGAENWNKELLGYYTDSLAPVEMLNDLCLEEKLLFPF